MTRLVFGALVMWSVAGSALAQSEPLGRLHFDLAGNDGQENSPRTGPTAQVNPALPDGGGRLFLYWQFGHASQGIYAIGFDLEIIGGTVEAAYFYKPELHLEFERWRFARPNPPETPGSGIVSLIGRSSAPYIGVRNHADFEQIDRQFDPNDSPFGSTLLGYVDVANAPGTRAEIFLRGNGVGIADEGVNVPRPVYFGFGDGAVDPLTGVSALRDAVILPEPASLLLLLAGAGVRRRPQH